MKKLLIILLTLVFSFLNLCVNAETGIVETGAILTATEVGTGGADSMKLISNKSKIGIDKTINLNIHIELTNANNIGDVNISGIENFFNLGQQSSFKFEDINGEQKGVYEMILTLKPRNFGSFVIGPASFKIGDKTLLSNSLEIEVVGVENANAGSGNVEKKVEMQDINDIKGPKNFFKFSFWFIPIFLVCLFFIGFYYLIKYYLLGKEEVNTVKKTEKKHEKSKTDYFIEKINKIEKNANSYDKSKFLALVNDLLREFLEYKGLKYARNMTFKELETNKSLIDSDLFNIIKDTYFEEFRDSSNDGEIDRKEILKEVKKQIK